MLLSVSVAQAQFFINKKVDALLGKMTLQEKIGQLNQLSNPFQPTGPLTGNPDIIKMIQEGRLGAMLNVTGAERTRELQQIAMQSRLKIPLLFGQDVIHGYRTIFPIPLAEAASWDTAAIRLSARIAATEAAAAGVHWTFAPMIDISRDPRWGRVMEGAGEEPYLGSVVAVARVKGFQGNGLGNVDALMACAKHFAAYGAAVGGRDYNSVDMSLRQLQETYLPPFKAAVEAGVATLMNAFNDLNGIPATGNKYLQRDILKGQWKFSGFVVSDWASVGEMIHHGFAKDNYDAAQKALIAGCDMDMESNSYSSHLEQLVKDGKVSIKLIDEAVRRILLKKFELGLFDNPFKFCNKEREQQQYNNPEHLNAALQIAQKSIVLLKNENQTLPISKNVKSVALIGPLVKSVKDHLGFWSYDWEDDSIRIKTLYDAVKSKLNKTSQLLYAKGCEINDSSTTGFEEAASIAKKSDIVIMYMGEHRAMSGEAKSKSNIHLPGVQEELIKKIIQTGKPVIVIIGSGRPLIFNYTAENAASILYTWWLGTRGADAIANVLFGDYNPSGKLPVTFPRTEGQIPVYYNHYNTGRPVRNENDNNYVSAYIDLPNSPQYPFGHGLSYTRFLYSDIRLPKNQYKPNETIEAAITVTNAGNYDGEEVVQLYIIVA